MSMENPSYTVSKKHLNNTVSTNGFVAGKTVYDDVFGGPPKFGLRTFSPRVEDYNEIFGGFHALRGSSTIPVLDLPAVDETEVCFDVRSSELDYSEVFGGFDFAFECDDLFDQAKCGNESFEEAWYRDPAETEALSKKSAPSTYSGKSQRLSNGGQSFDDIDQNYIAHYEANRRSQDGMPNETHVTQSPIIPGFTFVIDEITPSHKKEDKIVPSQVIDDINITSDFIEMDIGGNQLRKTMSYPPNNIIGIRTIGKDIIKPVRNYKQNGSFDNEMFITVSEISLRTDPSELPPPLRPPPIKKVDSGELALGASSPPFFDVEVDASSSALASAAAMKQVMEQAQAKLKSAKELMERKKEGLQNRSKLASKTDIKDKKVKITKMVDGLNDSKDERVRGLHEENSRREVPYFVEGDEFFDVVEKSIEKRHGKEFCSSQEFIKTKSPGEWKEANDFFELVKIDKARNTIDDASNGTIHLQYTEFKGQLHKEKKTTMEACEREDNKNLLKVLKETQMQEDKMKVNVAAEINIRKEDEKKFKISYDELRQSEKNKPMVDLWNDDLVKGQPKENYMEFEETMSQENNHKQQENNHKQQVSNDRTVNGKRLKKTAQPEEYKKQIREAFKIVETVEISKQNLENDELERRLKELQVQEELEKKQKEIHQREENERRLKEAHEKNESEGRLKGDFERKENEKKQKEARARELNENKIKEDLERKETERRLKEDFELKENEKKQKEAQERELDENKIKEDLELKENDKRWKEAIEKISTEKKQKEAHDREECEKEKKVLKRKEVEKRLSEVREREEYETGLEEAQKLPEREKITEEVNNQEGTGLIPRQGCIWAENKNSGHDDAEGIEQKGQPEAQVKDGNGKKMNLAQETRVPLKTDTLSACAEACKVDGKNIQVDKAPFDREGNSVNVEATKDIFTNEVGESVVETIEKESVPFDKRFEAGLQAEVTKPSKEDELGTAPRDQSENVKGESVTPSGQAGEKGRNENIQTSSYKEETKEKCTREGGQKGKNVGQDVVVLDQGLNKDVFRSTQMGDEGIKNNKKIGTAPSNISEGKKHIKGIAQDVNTRKSRETKGKNVSEHHRQEKVEKEWLKVEEELEQDRQRKLEEEREREREREKDRMAVERATREVRERACAESHERAERAAMEKATAETRQRALTEARERLEKACAEVREKSLADKSSMEARIRAERAAVERATAEARGRASEKVMAERAAFEARERAERSTSSIGSRYPVSSTHTGVEVESAQRCKARLERHQRTAERAAKALVEKNTRDLLAQREQTERNRLAESLDADVKRWSSGKEGNLRALLSTLQYILGPGSGWQPIPLTDVITAVGVKKAYRKATLCVHPDKLQQRRASIQQKYICEKVFDLLKEAWNKFNSEER